MTGTPFKMSPVKFVAEMVLAQTAKVARAEVRNCIVARRSSSFQLEVAHLL